MARLSIALLGPVQVVLDGQPVTHFETEKARALLAYLVLEADRPHRREFLAEMLWPDRPTGAACANLRHALASLRHAIGDSQTEPPFLLTSRDTLQFNRAADVWVDVAAFVASIRASQASEEPPIPQLEETVALVRGSFLEDLKVGDSAAFEEWLLLTREQLGRQALDALHQLADRYERIGNYQWALRHARRLTELEPWEERAQRQVMRLLAFAGRRSAALSQYEGCRRALDEQLGVQPEKETIDLYQHIRDDVLEIPSAIQRYQLAFRRPSFLDEVANESQTPVFVARERQMEKLRSLLDQALKGAGGVVFVTGSPGQGKTALLNEFARRAMEEHPALLVAKGDCSAYVGGGDPYQPFRDVMAMLTGDVETSWLAGSIRRDHARRLWNALPTVITTLLTHGTMLFGTILREQALVPRVAGALQDPQVLDRLQAVLGRELAEPADRDQSLVYEQITRVLRALADQHPLMLVLDDLQWADNASLGLLFHLGRRLAGQACRLLIACAYRPEELALGRAGEPHPLGKILHEFKRSFGDVWVDLDRTDLTEGRRFVDAFIDTEPNRLDESFRDTLFKRTEGQPLFTIELLRSMQGRGDLLRDKRDGAWIEGPALDWNELPPRVEAVLEDRVGRLDSDLQETLGIASVEGEVFTAQVIAIVQNTTERQLLRRLSQELEKRHRLVREHRETLTGPRPMIHYRFGHSLVQRYVYSHLSSDERRLLHGQVAAALERLYEGQLNDIALTLAHHYGMAANHGHAFRYFVRAAENAAGVYANDEAISHYTRALEQAERVAVDLALKAHLYHERGLASEALGRFEQARVDYETAVQIGRTVGDRRGEWLALLDLGKLWASRDYDQSLDCFTRALELARRMDNPAALAASLNWMGNWWMNAEKPAAAMEYHCQALEILERLGDRGDLANTLDLLGIACDLRADYYSSVGYYDRAVALFREIDDRQGLASSLIGRGEAGGAAYCSLAVVSPITTVQGRRDFEEALHIAREINSRSAEAWALWSMSLLHTVEGQFGPALHAAQSALDIASEIGHREWTVAGHSALGFVYLELLQPEEARRHLTQALSLAQELRSQHWIHQATGSLASAYGLLNLPAQAQACLETVISPGQAIDTMNRRYCWVRRAELALLQCNPALALDIADSLIASAPGSAPGHVITPLWRIKAEALASMGRAEEAHELLQAALENANAKGERFLGWRIHADLGRLFFTTKRRPEAEDQMNLSRALISELAETLPDAGMKDTFLRRTTATLTSGL